MEIKFKSFPGKLYQPGIYCIQSDCGKMYIGSAVTLYTRFMTHRVGLRKGKHDNPRLQNFYNKYPGTLTFYTLELCDREQLIEREQFYFDLLNPFFNICRRAGATYGNKPWLGRKHTEETKAKIKHTNLETGKLRKKRKWERRNQKIKDRMLGNQYWLGKKHKPETIAARMGNLNPNSRIVICNNVPFKTLKECAEFLGVKPSAIVNGIKRGNKVRGTVVQYA